MFPVENLFVVDDTGCFSELFPSVCPPKIAQQLGNELSCSGEPSRAKKQGPPGGGGTPKVKQSSW